MIHIQPRIKVHNIEISIDTSYDSYIIIKDGTILLPGINVYDIDVLPTCRELNSWLRHTHLVNILTGRDFKEFTSSGELGKNIEYFLENTLKSGLIYKSDIYKYKGNGKSYFEVYCKIIETKG